ESTPGRQSAFAAEASNECTYYCKPREGRPRNGSASQAASAGVGFHPHAPRDYPHRVLLSQGSGSTKGGGSRYSRVGISISGPSAELEGDRHPHAGRFRRGSQPQPLGSDPQTPGN